MKEIHQTIRSFIVSAVNTRKKLLKENSSFKNKMQMYQDIAFLETHLQANNYNSSQKMAGFFLRHRHRIENILPGKGSKSHLYFYDKFLEIKKLAAKCEVPAVAT